MAIHVETNLWVSPMKIIAAFLVTVSVATAQQLPDRTAFVSEASYLLGTYSPESPSHTSHDMAAAANAFLDTLNNNLHQRAALTLDSPERREWTNLPARRDAGGIRLGECNQTQMKAFCDLMASLFSQQGYEKMRNIMLADDQLLRGGQARPGFGTENFAIVLFGNPSATEPWAFQLDGHHVGVNVAIHGENLTLSPSFIGTQPEAFRISTQNFRPLAGEIDDAFQLVNSLTQQQRAEAVVNTRRGRITTGPGNDNHVPEPLGVSCATFDEAQKKKMLSLISHWVNDMPPEHADRRMEQIADELDEMRFTWNGPIEAISDVSYAIQGPSLIIEFACQDLGGNPLNHLHTMYRDPTNEYGKQLERIK
jgi:hypothetical protein